MSNLANTARTRCIHTQSDRGWFAMASVLLMTLVGCGGGVPVAQVSGVVTFEGKPVPNVIVNFKPKGGRPSIGQTDGSGRFSLSYSAAIPNGALIANHTVWLTRGVPMPTDDMSPVEYAAQIEAEQPTDEIPAKYFSDALSPLRFDITEDVDDLKVELVVE